MVKKFDEAQYGMIQECMREKDMGRWNLWREEHLEAKIRLEGADLRNGELEGINLSEAELREVDLGNANLNGADLRGADLRYATLAGANFGKAQFENTDLRRADLQEAQFTYTDFRGVIFDKGNLKRVDFTQSNLSGMDLSEGDLEGANFHKARLRETDFSNSVLTNAILTSIEAEKANFQGATLMAVNFTGAMLVEANFAQARMAKAKVAKANMRSAIFDGANLDDVYFNFTDLENASMLNVVINKKTNLRDTQSLKNCLMDHYILESLEGENKPLMVDRLDMDIHDDVAKLRSKFSGFWSWIHLLGLFVFFFPYVWFATKLWITARFMQDETSVSLWRAIIRFIMSGGAQWREGGNISVIAVIFFSIALIYNALRLALLIKTKTLELQETVRRMPVKFKLTQSRWQYVYYISHVLLALFILAILWNTWHFLTMQVPV